MLDINFSMDLSVLFLALITISLAAFTGYVWAKRDQNDNIEEIIGNTITYLASNNFIKITRDATGEIDEIVKLDDEEWDNDTEEEIN